jgi:hypothetical protein
VAALAVIERLDVLEHRGLQLEPGGRCRLTRLMQQRNVAVAGGRFSGNAVTCRIPCLPSLLVSPRASTNASPLGDESWVAFVGEGAQMLTDILGPALAF